jgi:hypothetical protein
VIQPVASSRSSWIRSWSASASSATAVAEEGSVGVSVDGGLFSWRVRTSKLHRARRAALVFAVSINLQVSLILQSGGYGQRVLTGNRRMSIQSID